MNKRRRYKAKARRRLINEDRWMRSMGVSTAFKRFLFHKISTGTSIPLHILLKKP